MLLHRRLGAAGERRFAERMTASYHDILLKGIPCLILVQPSAVATETGPETRMELIYA